MDPGSQLLLCSVQTCLSLLNNFTSGFTYVRIYVQDMPALPPLNFITILLTQLWPSGWKASLRLRRTRSSVSTSWLRITLRACRKARFDCGMKPGCFVVRKPARADILEELMEALGWAVPSSKFLFFFANLDINYSNYLDSVRKGSQCECRFWIMFRIFGSINGSTKSGQVMSRMSFIMQTNFSVHFV